MCGRIAVMENTRYNRQHAMRSAHFYFFDFVDDGDIARSLAKVLVYKDEVCGFLLGFPDLSAAIQRANGRFSPWSLVQLLRETKKTRSLIINGMGILPRFQRLGGNALLYYELAQTARSRRFDQVDLTQIAETTGLMLSDITALGAKIYKTHRIYQLRL